MMRKGRRAAWLAAALLVVAVGEAGAEATSPWRPDEPGLVLERLPSGSSKADPALRALVEASRARPGDLVAALALAHRYVEIGRAGQDPRPMGWAEAALAPWWDLPEPPPAVRLVRADLLQHRHDFAGALIELDAVLDADAREPRAWLAQAQVLMVTGRPDMARDSCARLLRLRQPFAGTVCLGSAAALTGEASRGGGLIERALAQWPGAPAILRAWALAALADIRRGQDDPDAAGEALAEAATLAPQDAGIANARADLHLARGEPEAALALTREDGGNDGKLLRATLAMRALGRPTDEIEAQLADRFALQAARGDRAAQREEARFTLELQNRPDAALAIAAANWRTQREVEDARLLLAAARAAARPDAAEPVRQWMRETGIVDARLAPDRPEQPMGIRAGLDASSRNGTTRALLP